MALVSSTTYTEFLAAAIETQGEIVEERLEEAFDRIDSDDSGCISKDNLKKLLQERFLGGSLTDTYMGEIIDECDTLTKDATVSYNEFLALYGIVGDHVKHSVSMKVRVH